LAGEYPTAKYAAFAVFFPFGRSLARPFDNGLGKGFVSGV
jgi:hypothetical protein